VTTVVPKAPPKPTVRPTRPKPVKPPVPITTKLTLTAKGNGSYVTVRDKKNKRLFQGLLGPGSSQIVTTTGDLRVSVGIPANLAITVNGHAHTTKLYRFIAHPNGTLTKPK
ncbi:DUF4115 domain-containing protein, partial [Kribbella turkmenica]